MCLKITLVLYFVSMLAIESVFAQETITEKESSAIYKRIELFSNRRKFTKFLYRLVFKPVTVSNPKNKVKRPFKKRLEQKPYNTFEGKIIRNINIVTLDPFGYSIADTIYESQNIVNNIANNLHIKSKHVTIRNLLLIRQNQLYDSLLVKESERLVRSQSYVRDVAFFTEATSKNSDSVDIFIRELDKWSITVKADFSDTRIALQLNDKNFSGLGHEFKNAYTWYHTTGDDSYSTNYYIPNIRNTFINTTFNYGTDEFRNFTRNFSVNRPFFSPFAKWAAGANFLHQFHMDSIHSGDSLAMLQKFKSNVQDYWAGYSMQIFKGNSENNRTTNFITAIRLLRTRFLEKPTEIYDTLKIYSDENFYMAGIGISKRKYVQDKYIFKYGVTEDVPIGKVYSLTGGYQKKNNTDRYYIGARISLGNHYKWGYLSTNFEYGTFFRTSHAEQSVFTAGIYYFTGLFEIGKWKFRQFGKPQVTIGMNRFPYENITINDGYGIDGFNSSVLSGTDRLLLALQTQSYAPWNFIGFRFGPYLILSFGMLGDALTGFKKSRIYSQFGLGVLIINENLVFKTFQVSISFYPIIPGTGLDVFKTNSFKTTDFGFRDYDFGKPSTIGYQ